MMIEVQWRRVSLMNIRQYCESVNFEDNINWEYRNLGEFKSVEHAIENIDKNYGQVLSCNGTYWFKENHSQSYIQIRFVHKQQSDSPWKIGLNENV